MPDVVQPQCRSGARLKGQRETLVLIDWLDLDTDEAAQVLHLSPNAVRVRLHRARSALRESLGGPR